MSHLIHRHLSHPPPQAVRGEGSYVIDASGKRYLDGSGGSAVSCLGHNRPEVIAAIQKQVETFSTAVEAVLTRH